MEAAGQLTIGQRLRRERERLNLSQEQLAEHIGTTSLSINRWEHDKTLPRPYYREQLCRLFNKNSTELFDRRQPEQTGQPDKQSQNINGEDTLGRKPPSIWKVPHLRNLYFTDREEVLRRLHTTLTRRNASTLSPTCAINGLGGIGKTQTALEYAYRYGSQYKAVLWARADSHKSLVSDFVALAEPLDLFREAEADQGRVVSAVKRWLQTNSQWLLILDNADDLEIVYEFLPSLGDGHTLLTTRSQATGPNIKGIELEKMGAEEGVLLLLRRAKLIAEDAAVEDAAHTDHEAARTICRLVDGLPLALDQAAAYIEENRCSPAAYVKLFQTRRTNLLQRRGIFSKRDYPHSVATTWSLSFERVEEADPVAANLLRLCAFLHPDAIPEELITAGISELGEILGSIAEDALRLDDAIGELRQYSLLGRNPETKTLTIHQLVQAVLKDVMGEEAQRAWAERAVLLVNHAFPRPQNVEIWPTCQQFLPHAQVCAELIEQWNMEFPAAAQLLVHTGMYLYERGHYIEAELLLQRALFMREQALVQSDADVAEGLHYLGIVYHAQGKFEQATTCLQRALSMREHIHGPEHVAVAASLTGLGWVYKSQGKYGQAEALLQRALSIHELVLGPIHPEVAEAVNELAVCYYEHGKYKQSEPLWRRTLSILKQVREANHIDIAKCYSNLAVINRQLGRYKRAEFLFLHAQTILEQVIGPTHPDLATSLSGLARLYAAQQKFAQAETLFLRVVAIREQRLGLSHPKVASSLSDLAKLYHTQGRLGEAEQLFQRAVAIQDQSLDTEHPDRVGTLRGYASLLRTLGREAEALTLEDRAQRIEFKAH